MVTEFFALIPLKAPGLPGVFIEQEYGNADLLPKASAPASPVMCIDLLLNPSSQLKPWRNHAGRERAVHPETRGGFVAEFEITLKWTGKGEAPDWLYDEYGFGVNPPIVVDAADEEKAKELLDLPANVAVATIERVSS